MQRVDYNKIAGSYDKGRVLTEQNMDMWLGLIAKYTKAPTNAKVLDLGCGTGRFAIPMAEKLGYRVTGADMSLEMLEKAREKDITGLVKWDLEDAQNLTYPDISFDIVLMSQIIHHCKSPQQAVNECNRVLKPGGVLLIRGCVIEEIRNDPENTFFPEARAINEKRIFSLTRLKTMLKKAGMENIRSVMVKQRSSENGQEVYEKMAMKNVSALSMITQEAFELGLKRLHEYVQKHPDDPWLYSDKMRITIGYKASDKK